MRRKRQQGRVGEMREKRTDKLRREVKKGEEKENMKLQKKRRQEEKR